jgi:hypothetical protein
MGRSSFHRTVFREALCLPDGNLARGNTAFDFSPEGAVCKNLGQPTNGICSECPYSASVAVAERASGKGLAPNANAATT